MPCLHTQAQQCCSGASWFAVVVKSTWFLWLKEPYGLWVAANEWMPLSLTLCAPAQRGGACLRRMLLQHEAQLEPCEVLRDVLLGIRLRLRSSGCESVIGTQLVAM